MGVPRQVLADTDLVGALRELRYEQEEGNRFRRTDGHNAVIDVLTVSQRDRQVCRRRVNPDPVAPSEC